MSRTAFKIKSTTRSTSIFNGSSAEICRVEKSLLNDTLALIKLTRSLLESCSNKTSRTESFLPPRNSASICNEKKSSDAGAGNMKPILRYCRSSGNFPIPFALAIRSAFGGNSRTGLCSGRWPAGYGPYFSLTSSTISVTAKSPITINVILLGTYQV